MIKKNIIALVFITIISVMCVENHVLPNFGHLSLNTVPTGAAIDMNGAPTGKTTPAKFDELLGGTYSFTFHLNGYRDTSISLTIDEGSQIDRTVQLTVYQPRGSITINSQPQGAQIFKDNVNTGLTTPNTITKVEAGTYAIKLHLDNYYDTTLTVTVIEDKNTNVGTVNLRKIPVYTITTSVKPVGAGTVTGNGNYYNNDTVTVSTTPNPGYKFVNWTEQNEEVSKNMNYTFIADRNRDLVANYVQIGTLIVNSDPAGAEIFLNGDATNQKTPYTFGNILAGQYIVTLHKKDFADTSVTVLVLRDKTTNTGAIYLRDILPEVIVSLSYTVNADGRLIFAFSFNQDVNLSKVDYSKPDGTTLTQNYGGQFVPKDRIIELPYPEKVTGIWKFIFYGNKAGGRQKIFQVEKRINVQ